jgi:NDP-hexose-3-ketoreductase
MTRTSGTPLRMGVLGCADIAVRRVLPAMAAVDGIALTAVASRDGARAERTAAPYGADPVCGYTELLRRDDVDAVYVPLPAALHAQWTEAALRAGKHVLAEKPLTTEVPRTAALLSLAEALGRGLMENVMFVHHGLHRAVRALVDEDRIGQPRSFHVVFGIPALPDTDIRHDPDLGGGALWDIGVYPLRAALHLLGTRLDVLGAHLVRGPGERVETSGGALLCTPCGITVQIAFGMDHGYRAAYELWGSEGRITVERAYTPPPGHEPVILLQTRAGQESIRLPAEDQVRATLTAFADSVRDGRGPAYDRVTPLRQAELLAAVRRAARSADAAAPREAPVPPR